MGENIPFSICMSKSNSICKMHEIQRLSRPLFFILCDGYFSDRLRIFGFQIHKLHCYQAIVLNCYYD